MSDVILRRYTLRSNAESGWAIIVIGSDGYFSAVSDHGNFAYIWGSPGCEFRKFLTRLDAHYFWTKITHMREATVWDEEATERNIRERLDELVAAGELSKEQADDMFEEAEGNVCDCGSLASWAADNAVPEGFNVYEGIAATKPEGWSWAFATRVLPRFQALLREELAAEASQQTGALPSGGKDGNGC